MKWKKKRVERKKVGSQKGRVNWNSRFIKGVERQVAEQNSGSRGSHFVPHD
jgi:hypothetical protein